ncbi:MAG: hypothetical protein FJW88_11695 [Actinobacteria bacterium]|nr:hypothetical protein [Actinomycetota bacterium]
MASELQDLGPDEREALGEMGHIWWLWLLLGIGWMIVSIIILELDENSVETVGLIIGIMFLVAGAQELLVAMVAEGWKWLWILFGVILIGAGIAALVEPVGTFAAFANMLGFLFLLVGAMWLVEAFVQRDVNPLWWLGLVAGIMMLILAFWAAGQFWITKAYTLLVFAGIWAMLKGVTDIFKAFQIKKLGKLVAR